MGVTLELLIQLRFTSSRRKMLRSVRPSNVTFPGVAELDISRAFPGVLYQILYHQLLVGSATNQYFVDRGGSIFNNGPIMRAKSTRQAAPT